MWEFGPIYYRPNFLLLTEGHTVGALVLGGITLVGTNQNAFQRAVVLGVALVSAGLDGAFGTLVGIAVHCDILLFFEIGVSMAGSRRIM